MVEPDRQDVLGDARKIEPLAAAVGENHEVEVNANGYDFLFNMSHRWLIFGYMHGTTEKNELTQIQAALSGKKGHIAAMTVGDEVEAIFVPGAHPVYKIAGSERSSRVAIAP